MAVLADLQVSDDVLGSFPMVRCLKDYELRDVAGKKDTIIFCESPHKLFFFSEGVMYYFEKV